MILPDAFLVAFAIGWLAGWVGRALVTPTRPGPRISFLTGGASASPAVCSRSSRWQFQADRGGDTGCVRVHRRAFDWSTDAPEVA